MSKPFRFWFCVVGTLVDLGFAIAAHTLLPPLEGLRSSLRDLFLVSGLCFAIGAVINYELWSVD